jgi:CheY-like chemotaxis protein
MPGITGFQLMKQIRSQPKLASIPLIVMTAEKSMLNQQRAKWSKSKFLSKPLSIEEIPQFKSELTAVLQEFAPITSKQYPKYNELQSQPSFLDRAISYQVT